MKKRKEICFMKNRIAVIGLISTLIIGNVIPTCAIEQTVQEQISQEITKTNQDISDEERQEIEK